jgi:aldehyde:ferredoxin oxidoreductase
MLHARGPVVTIDVGTGETIERDRSTVLREFVGGRGVGTRLAHERIPFDADPFGPENRLVFATGPLQSATTSFTGRLSCTGLSPLTDGLLSSNAGGFLSRNFGATGYSAVQVVGGRDELAIVHVRDDDVWIESVPELAGALTSEVSAFVDRRHGLGAEHVACVGPAGENRVRFASIMTSDHRTFGRGGLGAVLGAKNVKALTFDGDATPEIDVPDVAGDVHREAATSDSVMKRQGTAGLTTYADEVGALPTRYFAETSFEGAASVGGDAVEAKKYKRGTCSQCAFACKLPTRDEERGIETEGPEFETVMAFGSNAGIEDVRDVMRSNDRCDEFGMDTISCGDVVSAYLASQDAFGDAALVDEIIGKIARREGVGDLLAEGIARSHDRLGVENWSTKGMEFAAHDGRTLNGQALAFAVSNRGADHLYGSMYVYEYPLVDPERALDPTGFEGKATRLVRTENRNAVLDSGIVCRFSRDVVDEERLARLLSTSVEELQSLGARIVDLERHFNNRRGFDRADDTLPYHLSGIEGARAAYYEERGWNADGTVPRSRVE